MGMTMTQKILAHGAGLEKVEAGQLIMSKLDLVLGNDITSPVAIKEMGKFNKTSVFDKDKIALVPDHFVPNKDIKSAEHCKCVREFARKNDITNYFEVGDTVLVFSPNGDEVEFKVTKLYNKDMVEEDVARHPDEVYYLYLDSDISIVKYSMIRKVVEQ